MEDAQSVCAALAEHVLAALGEGDAFTLWYRRAVSECNRCTREKCVGAGHATEHSATEKLASWGLHA